MNKKSIFAAIVLGICFPVMIFLSALQLAVFDKGFFTKELEYNRVSLNTGISREDLSQVTDEIFAYLKGDRPDFNIHAEIKGVDQAIFNADEITHMEDVLFLYRIAWWTWVVTGVLTVLSLVLLLFWNRLGIARGIFWGAVVMLGLLLILGLAGLFDFTAVFEGAHRLIFTNDLWYLDPRESVLINIVPEHYFIMLCLRIALYTAGALLIAAVISRITLHKNKKKQLRLKNRKF
ncbi:MAG: TIGR01906 family membrane protein [Eubacterium sp.]|nr:TIGR01906 family membrane protein [Eubacterium sp.]